MSFEDETDGYDPEVEDRFKLLDRLPTPPLQADRGPQNPVAHFGSAGGRTRRPLYALASAAAIVMVAGLSYVALSGGDGGQGVKASDLSEVGGEGGGADSGQNAPEQPAELTVSVPAEASDDDRAASASSGGGDDEQAGVGAADGDSSAQSQSGSDGSDSAAGATTTAGGSGPNPDGTDPDGGVTTTRTNGDGTDDTWPESTLTTNPRPTMPPVSEGGEPVTTDSPPPDGGVAELVTIRGTITELFTDCQSKLVLTDSNKVESVSGVSCDGGSHIIVNGSHIQTSAGYVAADAYYDKHPANHRPGQSVVVVARRHDGGWLSLDCDSCGVR